MVPGDDDQTVTERVRPWCAEEIVPVEHRGLTR
jgi:hypothetical protein